VLARIAQDIETHWGPSPVFVDLEHAMNAGIRESSGVHLLELLAQEARRVRPLFPTASNLVPVTGLSRSLDYQNAVSSIVEEDKTARVFGSRRAIRRG